MSFLDEKFLRWCVHHTVGVRCADSDVVSERARRFDHRAPRFVVGGLPHSRQACHAVTPAGHGHRDEIGCWWVHPVVAEVMPVASLEGNEFEVREILGAELALLFFLLRFVAS